MIRKAIFAAGAFAIAFGTSGLLRAEEQPAPQGAASPASGPAAAKPAGGQSAVADTAAPAPAAPETATAKPEGELPAANALAPNPAGSAPEAGKPASEPAPAEAVAKTPATPEAEALQKALVALPEGQTDEERNERAALLAFYEARGYGPLWLTPQGAPTPQASAVFAEIARAGEWGLDAGDFVLPASETAPASLEATAADEIKISQAVLKYGRYARGGRIMKPSEQLSSYLDRRPQLLKPGAILDGISAADDAAAYLRGLNPQHPQFEKLRQKYLALLNRNKKQSARTKRRLAKLLANMEEWRWMHANMGNFYIWNNVPDFTQRVVKNGKVIRKVRIVAGEKDKQTAVFTRNLKKITFRPTWIVPDSIKAREIWPSLLHGGRLMREWQLEMHTKDGRLVDWRRIDWTRTNILKYDVIQPNGPKTVLGRVKFTFPSQHTIFMHGTRAVDKWMFRVSRRTYSHGCMRVADPVGLAKLALKEDKGWTAARVEDELYDGPLNNEIVIDHKIPVHTTYFTALVGKNGKLRTFPDVYGHERRIRLALEGKWNRIVKGRNHLAPVKVDLSAAYRQRDWEDEPEETVWGRERYWRDDSRGRGGLAGFLFGD